MQLSLNLPTPNNPDANDNSKTAKKALEEITGGPTPKTPVQLMSPSQLSSIRRKKRQKTQFQAKPGGRQNHARAAGGHR